MKARMSLLTLVVASLLPATTLTAAASTPEADFGAIDRYVSSQLSEAGIPGLALGIVHEDQVVHLQGFGHADSHGTPVTPTTPFFIGSLSKSFTALAVMQLVEVHRIGLDAPVQEYLPEFRLADPVSSTRITVRQLLNQTSGIPTEAGIAPLSQKVTTLADQIRSLARVKPVSNPGARYAYSNANYEVLGRLVEVISGESYGDYLRSHILAPLQMPTTYSDVESARAAGLASAATLWFGLPQWHEPGSGYRADTVPAGFLMSSVSDMSHYLLAQLDGGRYGGRSILLPAGIAELHRGVASAGLSAEGGAYAMGWFTGPRGHIANTIWHNGSAAGMHAMVEMVPGNGWGLVILVNAESLLYEFLARLDVIADNVMAMLVGQGLSGTLAGLYPIFDVVAVVMVGITIRNLIRIVRRRPKFRTGRFARARSVFFNWIVPIWRELWVPVAILVGLPVALGAPWIGNLLTTDVGQWLFAFALLLLAAGATRVVVAIRRSVNDGEDFPGVGDALQLLDSPAFEPDRRARGQVLDRP